MIGSILKSKKVFNSTVIRKKWTLKKKYKKTKFQNKQIRIVSTQKVNKKNIFFFVYQYNAEHFWES